MAGQVPWNEAVLAMIAMMIVLVFVLIYYCVMPIYHAIRKRKQQEEEAWERDPRWSGERFKFMPRRPENYWADKKYSRLAACSRSSSFRSDNGPSGLGPLREEDAEKAAGPAPLGPPKYTDLFETTGSSLASTPPLYSSKTPSIEISSSNEMVNESTAAAPLTATEKLRKQKIVKPKKSKPKTDAQQSSGASVESTPEKEAAAEK